LTAFFAPWDSEEATEKDDNNLFAEVDGDDVANIWKPFLSTSPHGLSLFMRGILMDNGLDEWEID
jgi:hypothetical protein